MSAELVPRERIHVRDRILVATSGHSAPDSSAEVVGVDARTIRVRLEDGRVVHYVPSRLVPRIRDDADARPNLGGRSPG